MRRLSRLAVLTFSVTAAGCATMTVSSHSEPGLDLAQYQTWDWAPADALPTGDPRLDQDPFFKDQVQGAIERGLELKGLKLVAVGTTPDLQIHYHAHISQRIDIIAADRDYESCVGAGCQPPVTVYEAGTLVVDIVDTRTNRVIWRGWAQDSVEGVLDDRDKQIGRAHV